jgi:hypothetical protein
MQYLDFDKFKAIDADEFAATHPYPWINPQGLLTDEGYQSLLDNMPDVSLFEKKFGYGRLLPGIHQWCAGSETLAGVYRRTV